MGPITEQQARGLSVSTASLSHLTNLISSLLEFSRLTSGTLKLRLESCSIKEPIESCITSLTEEAKRKRKEVEFITEIPPDLPLVHVDPDHIREVIVNLLSNAVKFTEGQARVKISVTALENEDFITVSVADNGIGIPKEHLLKVFERFYQVDSSSTRKYGGTGIGLAIVKEILEAHGSHIRVESEVGVGSKFTFRLPISGPIQEPVQPRIPEPRPHKHRGPKLVEVVEDDANIASMIKMILEQDGYVVIPASSGKDALTIALEHRPDLITLDIFLPDMDGFDLLKALQTDERTHNIPVIVLSILVDKQRGFQLGATDYLTKPIDVEKLRETVERIGRALDGQDSMGKIMVIDDDADTLQYLVDRLSTEGYKVCPHLGGRRAWESAREEQPDLILLDLLMPEVDGFDVLQQLKADATTKNIPVIVLTAKGRIEERDKSILLGAKEFMVKPFAFHELLEHIKKCFVPAFEKGST